MTLQQLADRISEQTGDVVTRSQLSRIELSRRQLTAAWMAKVARALSVDVSELVHTATIMAPAEEIAPPPDDLAPLMRLAETFGGRLHKVRRSAVSQCGISDGDLIIVRPGEPKPGDILLVEINGSLGLRQFWPPSLLTTNRAGANSGVQMDDRSLAVRVVGVVERYVG